MTPAMPSQSAVVETSAGSVANFPAILQPIISQGFLDREFEQALRSRTGYRACADRQEIVAAIGETVTKTRAGLGGATERFSLTLSHHCSTTDLNMITSRVGIAGQFLQNAAINGEQAGHALNKLAGKCLSAAIADRGLIIRSNGRASAAELQATDTLTMGAFIEAVAKLRSLGVPEIDGAYNCYLDPASARQLFADEGFRQLFRGATSANQVFRNGMVNDFLGLRFVPTTEAGVEPHPTLVGAVVRRPIIVGRGALVEGDFAGMAESDIAPSDSIVSVVDGIAMVTREPIDRLRQIIAQSWYWIGGFGAPFDQQTGAYQRGVAVEHVG